MSLEITRDFKVVLSAKDVRDALIAFIKQSIGEPVPLDAKLVFTQQSQSMDSFGAVLSWEFNGYVAPTTRRDAIPAPPDEPKHRGRGPYGTNPDDKNIVDRDHPDFDLMYSDFGPK